MGKRFLIALRLIQKNLLIMMTKAESHTIKRKRSVALVETDGTNVLCYGSREAAQSALDGMNDDEEESSVRPNDMNKIWKGSGFETPRCCP
jgi:hypothetical protein